MPELMAGVELSAAADREFVILMAETIVVCLGAKRGGKFLRELGRRAERAQSLASVSLIRSNAQVTAARMARVEGADLALAALPRLSACLPSD